jgi:hypothetical protein
LWVFFENKTLYYPPHTPQLNPTEQARQAHVSSEQMNDLVDALYSPPLDFPEVACVDPARLSGVSSELVTYLHNVLSTWHMREWHMDDDISIHSELEGQGGAGE